MLAEAGWVYDGIITLGPGQADQLSCVTLHLGQNVISGLEPVLRGDRRVVPGISPAGRFAHNRPVEPLIDLQPADLGIRVGQGAVIEQVLIEPVGKLYFEIFISIRALKAGPIKLMRSG